MNYREKLEEFVKDLNVILNDDLLFPAKKPSKFDLIINEDRGLKIYLYFKEAGTTDFPIYIKHFDENSSYAFEHAYYEIFRNAFLTIDAVEKCKDPETGIYINFLSFTTLLTSGLDKLRK